MPPVHLRLRGKLDQPTERLALRATLAAAHLLGLATGTHLRNLRSPNDPLADLQARLELAELRARLAWEYVEMIGARFEIPESHRPYYTPAQRFRILEIKNMLAWNARQTAKVFLVCQNTILNWERSADPETKTAGVTVKPVPPIRRAADVVRALVQTMARLGFGGQDITARILARAGWTVSARSVGRYRRERTVLRPDPAPAPPTTRVTRPVIARFVHHTWMMDVSVVRQLLGPDLHMASVFDAFSRVPLVLRVFDRRPTARDMARLFGLAARRFTVPQYLITDLGGEFTAAAFRKAVKRLGVVQRFAANDSIKATARLERFWRTLKQTAGLYLLGLPLDRQDLECRLAPALAFYLCFRPHEGLQGATPAEALLGTEPKHLSAVEPQRGRREEGPSEAPFRIQYLDPDSRRCLVLEPAA